MTTRTGTTIYNICIELRGWGNCPMSKTTFDCHWKSIES